MGGEVKGEEVVIVWTFLFVSFFFFSLGLFLGLLLN